MPKATGWHNIEAARGTTYPMKSIILSIIIGINACIGLLILVLNQQL